MNLTIVSRHRPVTDELHDLARRAITHALDRFADRIREVRLRMEDINAMRGGVDQSGSLALVLDHGQTLHFHALRETPEAAIHELADLARNSLVRLLQRRRARRRVLG